MASFLKFDKGVTILLLDPVNPEKFPTMVLWNDWNTLSFIIYFRFLNYTGARPNFYLRAIAIANHTALMFGQLELRQYKNDSIEPKNRLVLKLPRSSFTYTEREKGRQFQN